jgi:glutamate-ammonia-ligase adenylyltransferase
MPPHAFSEQVQTALSGGPFTSNCFTDPAQAGAAVRHIVKHLELNDPDLTRSILAKVLASADPQMALYNFQRLVESSPDPGAIRVALKRSSENITIIVTLMAGSQFLSEVLIGQPTLFSWLISFETLFGARAPDYYRIGAQAAVDGISDRADQRRALSQWRRREYLRIGVRDLLLIADAEEVSRDISDLAEAIIDQAAMLIFADLSRRFGVPVPEESEWLKDEQYSSPGGTGGTSAQAVSSGMCVLGMGKLGGRELNFSSDIDLVFIYESEGQTTGREEGARRVAVISNHDFFTRMGEALIKFLGERGPDGNLFRVDMRLRPEGMDGPLARSLEALVHYLNTQARDWERLAYLKARVVSGPPRLAEKLYRIIGDFVFAGLDAGRIITEVQELKLRIDREVINSDLYHREVKRGFGGIREIEFVVAAMQIIHGFHHHALRVRNSFLAIQRLLEAHILDEETAAFYQRAYSFLRMVEHRLQMAQEAQTHTLPPHGPAFEAMARRCGFADGATFQAEYTAITSDVHSRFTEFFQHDITGLEQAARDILLILDRSAAQESREALARRGIDDENALRLIHALAYGTRDVFVAAEGQRFFEQMLPSLLRLTVAAPFPGRVLSHLHSFALAIKGITYYYEVLSQHPDILKLLVTLFGTSDMLSVQFIAHPEFFDALISARTLDEPDLNGVQRRERMNTALSVKSPVRRLEMLRRVVQFEQIVTALKYLLRIEPLEASLLRLTNIADDAMNIAAQLAAGRLLAKWTGTERPPEADVRELALEISRSMTVIALGKYGGWELNFFGDLDVVFVYDGERDMPVAAQGQFAGPQEFFDAVADAIMGVLSEQVKGGRAYAIDARLRPHGKSAPLTTEAGSYREYLQGAAGIWELQAFTRARAVWGNGELLPELTAAAVSRAQNIPADVLAGEVSQMRARVEEAADISPETLEVKRSAGGVLDVEFLLQYLTLVGRIAWDSRGANYFHLLGGRPIPAIGALNQARLRAAYSILRAIENTIRLISGTGDSGLTVASPSARAASIALGFGTVENLTAAAAEAKAEVRGIWEQIMPAAASEA